MLATSQLSIKNVSNAFLCHFLYFLCPLYLLNTPRPSAILPRHCCCLMNSSTSSFSSKHTTIFLFVFLIVVAANAVVPTVIIIIVVVVTFKMFYLAICMFYGTCRYRYTVTVPARTWMPMPMPSSHVFFYAMPPSTPPLTASHTCIRGYNYASGSCSKEILIGEGNAGLASIAFIIKIIWVPSQSFTAHCAASSEGSRGLGDHRRGVTFALIWQTNRDC